MNHEEEDERESKGAMCRLGPLQANGWTFVHSIRADNKHSSESSTEKTPVQNTNKIIIVLGTKKKNQLSLWRRFKRNNRIAIFLQIVRRSSIFYLKWSHVSIQKDIDLKQIACKPHLHQSQRSSFFWIYLSSSVWHATVLMTNEFISWLCLANTHTKKHGCNCNNGKMHAIKKQSIGFT